MRRVIKFPHHLRSLTCHQLTLNCGHYGHRRWQTRDSKPRQTFRSAKDQWAITGIFSVRFQWISDCEIWGFHGGEDDGVLLGFGALSMELVWFSETLASTDESTGCQNPEEHHHRILHFFTTLSRLQTLCSRGHATSKPQVITAVGFIFKPFVIKSTKIKERDMLSRQMRGRRAAALLTSSVVTPKFYHWILVKTRASEGCEFRAPSSGLPRGVLFYVVANGSEQPTTSISGVE
jgi:hypothetical protein